MSAISFSVCPLLGADAQDSCTAEIYYIDKNLLTLVPMEINVEGSSLSRQAEYIVNKLIEGKDSNQSIKRFIPKEKHCMSVRVDKNKAYVNLSNEFIEAIPNTYEGQVFTIYSIVNSLTSVEGIDLVKFRVEGKEKNPFRYVDLRESFIPDYI